jgi:hypothetical protein
MNSSPHIIYVLKLMEVSCTNHIAHMEEVMIQISSFET